MKVQLCMFALLLVSCQAISQDRIVVNIPTVVEEAEYIWQTINDTRFFEENNYYVNLPKGELIDELKTKSRAGALELADYERLETFVRDSVYRESDYQEGYTKIVSELVRLNIMLHELGRLNFKWVFKQFSTYQINLTLYGPGGSYDPEQGSVTMFTDTAGQFKNYDNPANTIIHEIVHIGIEGAIVNKYNIPHALKERIVDTIVFLNFAPALPDYRIQDMGETRSDPFIKTKADIENLENLIEKMMQATK